MVVEIDRLVGTSVYKSKGSWMVIVLCVSTRLDHFELKSFQSRNFSTFTFFYPALLKKKKKLLEYKYSTVLDYFLLYSKVNQLYVHIYLLFFEFLQKRNSMLICQLPSDKEFPVLYNRFSLVISLYIAVYIRQSQSPNSSHSSFSPLVSLCLFSTSLSLFLLCR